MQQSLSSIYSETASGEFTSGVQRSERNQPLWRSQLHIQVKFNIFRYALFLVNISIYINNQKVSMNRRKIGSKGETSLNGSVGSFIRSLVPVTFWLLLRENLSCYRILGFFHFLQDERFEKVDLCEEILQTSKLVKELPASLGYSG